MNASLEILQEDNDIIVCRKPFGIPVQTAKTGQQDMISLLRNHRAGKREVPEIYVIHRLDQPVEGIMVFAKNQKAAASLSRQIQQKSIDKYYYALAEGKLMPQEGKLENYLLRDGKSNTSKVVTADTRGAKKAILYYKVLQIKELSAKEPEIKESQVKEPQVKEPQVKEPQIKEALKVPSTKEPEAEGELQSLIEVQLETGRHHQIRVQMAHAGFPLVGDKKYNSGCRTGYMPIGLCSIRLAFVHPSTGKRLEFSIEPQGEAFRSFRDMI